MPHDDGECGEAAQNLNVADWQLYFQDAFYARWRLVQYGFPYGVSEDPASDTRQRAGREYTRAELLNRRARTTR